MRHVAWFALLAAVMVGCMKSKPRDALLDPTGGSNAGADAPTPPAPKGTRPTPRSGEDASGSRIINTKGNLTVKGGEAFGAPRAAGGRVFNDNALRQFHLALSQILIVDDRVPDDGEVKQILRENSQLSKLVEDEVVIITGTRNKDGVFAYSQWPQRGGRHYVVTRQGVEELAPVDLKKRLEDQGSPVKLSN